MTSSVLVRPIAPVVLLALAFACTGNSAVTGDHAVQRGQPEKTAQPSAPPSSAEVVKSKNVKSEDMKSEDVKITENTAAYVADEKIAVFHIVEQEYLVADGETKRGMAAIVSWGNERDQTVGLGSQVRIGGTLFDVVAIDGGSEDEPGHVVLRPAP